MSTQANIAAGYDTTYVPQDVAAARHRAANRTAARKNLAAIMCDWYAVDPTRPSVEDSAGASLAAKDFKLLCDALGLTSEPDRQPGYCRCGTKLPIAATAPSDGKYKFGMCRSCTAGGA